MFSDMPKPTKSNPPREGTTSLNGYVYVGSYNTPNAVGVPVRGEVKCEDLPLAVASVMADIPVDAHTMSFSIKLKT